jgi:hypothetical protein
VNVAVLLGARRVRGYFAVLVALGVLSWWVGPATMVLDFNFFRPRVELGYPELCAVVAAGAGAALLRPRFWEWERAGTVRAGWLAAGYALTGSVAPVAVTAVGALQAAGRAPVAFTLSNAAVVAAVTLLVAPLVGPVVAGPVILLVYLGHALLNDLWFDWAFLPVTRYPDPRTHWTAVAGLLVAVVVTHVRTRGATAWAQRTFARDD